MARPLAQGGRNYPQCWDQTVSIRHATKELCNTVDSRKFRHPNYLAPLRALIASYSEVRRASQYKNSLFATTT